MFDLSNILLKLNQHGIFLFYHLEAMIDSNYSDKLRYRIRVSPDYRRADLSTEDIDDSSSFNFEKLITEVYC